MLQAIDLCCVRGERRLFAGVGFTLSAGSWLQVKGDNGAGKTTMLRTLCGLSPPETGEIRWNDTHIGELGDDYRANVLFLGHHAAVKEDLSPLENLMLASEVKGWQLETEAARAALTRIGLAGREDLPARILSQGQKRRVALAQLLVSREPLWILDEPFAALDAGAIAAVTKVIAGHLAAGGMAVLTSHQPAELPESNGLSLELAG